MRNLLHMTCAAAAVLAALLFGVAQVVAQQPPLAAARHAGARSGSRSFGAQLSMPVATTFTSKIGFFTPDRIPGAQYPRVIQLKIGTG